MDSVLLTRVFRRLFSHLTCSRLQSYSPRLFRTTSHSTRGYAWASEYGSKRRDGPDSQWQQRPDIVSPDQLEEFQSFPTVTADALRRRKNRPRQVKMLMRDFIEGKAPHHSKPFGQNSLINSDSLYNFNYGYFSKKAIIFSPGEPFDFTAMADEPDFYKLLGMRYTEFEDKLDERSPDESRQLWHTPTELFRPHYGEAIARYLVEDYNVRKDPSHDLIIYEMGAGNGTLMLNILDHIRDFYPDVYERTKFRIIEISSALASLQAAQLTQSASSRGHVEHVEIINRSIFSWDKHVATPCYFLAMEVFDNFGHDVIRYHPFTEEPLQGTVIIDGAGEFYEFYSKHLDPVASRFLKIRDGARIQPFDHPLRSPRFIRNLKARLPFVPNLSKPEYIPTKLMQFFDILRDYFPSHKLLISDFHQLPGTINGVNAPVVQTRYRRRVIPVSTPLVSHQRSGNLALFSFHIS